MRVPASICLPQMPPLVRWFRSPVRPLTCLHSWRAFPLPQRSIPVMSSVAPWPLVEPLWLSWSLLLNQANRDFIWPPLPTVPSMPSVYGVARLFNPDPAAYLPHRYPFLMLDRLLTLEAGVSASAERRAT